MQGYDLDDTLARVDFAQASHKPLAQLFAGAPVIFAPKTEFVVITGRPHDLAAERAATLQWLRDHQPGFQGIHYVTHGSDARTAEAKGAIIKRLALTDYTDNNPGVLKAMSGLDTGARLWQMTAGGQRKPYPGVDQARLARLWAPTHPLAQA